MIDLLAVDLLALLLALTSLHRLLFVPLTLRLAGS